VLRPIPFSKVFAVGLGNALEFYDFLTYSFFAIQIGHTFFPAQKTSHGLLFSLATFGVGFVSRPLGGVIIGAYADRVGRRPAMTFSFSLMGIAITGLALTPSYDQIGALAPILLVLFRLAQGFALGGEVGPSTAYLVEAAPPERRGLYVSLQYMTQDAAVLAAGIVGFALSSWLTPAALDAWGWRVAFLLGALVVPVGLVIRRSLPETLHASDRESPASDTAKIPRRLVVLSLMMLASMTIVLYSIDYLATYAQDSLHMTPSQGFGAIVVVGVCTMTFDPITGLLADRFGRKPVMLTATVLLMVAAIPSFALMAHTGSVIVVYAGTAVLSVLSSLAAGPTLIAITESFPKHARARTLGTLYAVAVATFGGTTQIAVKWLTDVSKSPLAPACYMTSALAVGVVAMLLMRETAPTPGDGSSEMDRARSS
jgi:MFS family permease